MIMSGWWGEAYLDELLVLVELLQVINRLVLEVDELGSVDVGSVGENADAHSWSGQVGELDGTRETLVTLGLHNEARSEGVSHPAAHSIAPGSTHIIVLEANLELDGLDEVSLLLLGAL